MIERSSGKAGCGRVFGMDSKSCGCLGGTLDSLDTCHHPGADQILTTTPGLVKILGSMNVFYFCTLF